MNVKQGGESLVEASASSDTENCTRQSHGGAELGMMDCTCVHKAILSKKVHIADGYTGRPFQYCNLIQTSSIGRSSRLGRGWGH